MKRIGKVKKLFGAIGLAIAAFACAALGLIGLNDKTVAKAEDAAKTTETTHFSGIRSSTVNTIYLYWRLDGADLGSPSASAIEVDWYEEGSEVSTKKYVKLTYDKVQAQNINNTGSTALRYTAEYVDSTLKDSAPVIKIDWFSNEACTSKFNAQTNDRFILPEGTTFSSASVDYVLDQDYEFTFGGSNNTWALSDETHIPVGINGFRSGGNQKDIYLYGLRLLDNYVYAYNDGSSSGYTVLNQTVTVDYKTSADATATSLSGVTFQLEKLNSENATSANPTVEYVPCLHITLPSAVDVGSVIVLKKGTVMDNYVLDRDYTLTQISANTWSMSAETTADDPTAVLTMRGTNLTNGTGIYLFTTGDIDFVENERFAKNVAVSIKGKGESVESVYTKAFFGLAGTNSFAITFNSACTTGDIVTLSDGMYIAGYRLNGEHNFLYSGTSLGWTKIACNGTDHVWDNSYDCKDKTCSCGEEQTATEEHTVVNDNYCLDQTCSVCGDTVMATASHTFATGTYACKDRTCTTCSQLITATENHVYTSDNCDATCSTCGDALATHEWPEEPQGGWTEATVNTVTTEPTCTTAGEGTIVCQRTGCGETQTVTLPALGHDYTTNANVCSNCNQRKAYTENDMDEVLALNGLVNYQYSDTTAEGNSTKGELTAYGNNAFLINTASDGNGVYTYTSGKDSAHDMTVSFSVTLTEWASSGRSSYVWLNAHENGSWGIGFQFCFYGETSSTIRAVYKSLDDNSKIYTIEGKVPSLSVALNARQTFKLGVVQNDDESYFIFAYHGDNLVLTCTLTTDDIAQYGVAENHNGLGGAVAFRFNGDSSSSSPAAPVGKICNATCEGIGSYACVDYTCTVCGQVYGHSVEHDMSDPQKTFAGSCTKSEEYTSTCSVCQKEEVTYGELVHTWDTENPIVDTPAGCGQNQVVHYECSLCDETSEQVTISGTAMQHNWDKANATILTPAACNGVDRVEQYVCLNCSATSDPTTIAGSGFEGGHTYTFTNILPATCSAGGTEQGTCTRCSAQTAVRDTPVNTAAHAYGTLIAEIPGTCSADGTRAHYECSLCHKLFVKGENDVYTEVAAADLSFVGAHSYQKIEAVAATALADGVKEHYKCSLCSKLFVLNESDEYVEVTAADLRVAYVAPQAPDSSTATDSTDSTDSTTNSATDSTTDSASDEKEKDEGCGSSVSAMSAIATLTLLCAAVTVARKRKN